MFVGSIEGPETPFEKKAEEFKIDILNKVLEGQSYTMEDDDKIIAFALCGAGYRRTGHNYPALKLFGTFDEENDQEGFLFTVYDELDECYDTLEHSSDDTEIRLAKERIVDLVYLLSAIVDLITDEGQKEAAQMCIDGIKDTVNMFVNTLKLTKDFDL